MPHALAPIFLLALASCMHSPAADKSQQMATSPDHDLLTVAGFNAARQHVVTEFGRIAYVEAGNGPAAVFLHGFPLNGYHWRHQLRNLADTRRCIAIDMMGLGHTQVADDQSLSFEAQAEMILATLDALGVERFDLVGNDTGGGIAQLVATKAPSRLRSLVLTNADTHDNYPPKALTTVHDAAVADKLDELFLSYVKDPSSARTGLGALVFENPAFLTDSLVEAYLGPITATPAKRSLINRYISSQNNAEMVAIEPLLQKLDVPTLIMWATSDPFFGIEWAYWLRDRIPGADTVIEFEGARLFFTEEHAAKVSEKIRQHWQGSQ